MGNIVQRIAAKRNMSIDEFLGEMRKRGCSQPTAIKIWNGNYEKFDKFKDNDVCLSNLRKAADVLQVATGMLLLYEYHYPAGFEKLELPVFPEEPKWNLINNSKFFGAGSG
jgi:hypothetical protein